MKKLLIFLVLALICSSCSEKHSHKKIRVGINSWPGYEFAHLAKVKKFFEEEGADVAVIYFDSLSDGRRAFEKKQIDILGATLVELVISRAQSNVDGQVLLVGDYSNGADVIVTDKKYKSIKELKGKNIGVEVGTLTVYGLTRALNKNGLKIEDIKLIPMDQNQAEEQFAKKNLDAMVTYPPFSINLIKKFQLQEIFTSKEIPEELVDVMIADKKFIEENREEVKKFIKAYFRAVNYTLADNNDGIKIMADREKITVDEFNHAIKEDIVIENLDKNKTYYFKSGVLTKLTENIAKMLVSTQQIKENVSLKDITSDVIYEVKP